MAKRSGLGRGLESLMGGADAEVAGVTPADASLPISDIQPNKDQPRKRFDEESLDEVISDEAKKEQEQRSLLLTQDGFKKIIITKDALAPLYNDDGVLVMGLFDFLLKESSLDL